MNTKPSLWLMFPQIVAPIYSPVLSSTVSDSQSAQTLSGYLFIFAFGVVWGILSDKQSKGRHQKMIIGLLIYDCTSGGVRHQRNRTFLMNS